MKTVKTIVMFSLIIGCDPHDAPADEKALQCAQPLEHLQDSPGIDDLVAAAEELRVLECSELSTEDQISFRWTGGYSPNDMDCGCSGPVCVCTCGGGGKCEGGPYLWVCGC